MVLDNYSSSFLLNKFSSCLETSVCFLDQTCGLKLLKNILKNALVIKLLFVPVMINIHLFIFSIIRKRTKIKKEIQANSCSTSLYKNTLSQFGKSFPLPKWGQNMVNLILCKNKDK